MSCCPYDDMWVFSDLTSDIFFASDSGIMDDIAEGISPFSMLSASNPVIYTANMPANTIS